MWEWSVTGYYSKNVTGRKQPYGLAVSTVHRDKTSRDMEVQAFLKRKDIGRIVIEEMLDD
jgi:hypothetical protein